MRLISTIGDIIIATAEVIRARRELSPDPKLAMRLTAHERQCIARYRGRCIAQKLGAT